MRAPIALALGCLLVLMITAGLRAAAPAAGQARKGASPEALEIIGRRLGERGTVVVFIGVECPVANAYVPLLNRLSGAYEASGVNFVGVNSNAQDTDEAIERHVMEFGIRFEVVRDREYRLAGAFRAERTPEAFLMDRKGKVLYRGRIDDQYGVGARRSQPGRADLATAIDEFLSGKPVSVPRTEAAGCPISRDEKRSGKVTYSGQAARIIQEKCEGCHREGGPAPFALAGYEKARAWSKAMREAVESKRMPPWHADPRFGKFTNDRSLSPAQRDALLAWIDQGTLKGVENEIPPPRPKPGKWSIGEPDLVLTMPEAFDVPAEGVLPYKRFIVETGLKDDAWIQRAQAIPGSSAVHHILVFVHEPGRPLYDPEGNTKVVCGQAPGDLPTVLPEGAAKKIPAGARLVFEVHYTPNGKAAKDRSSVGLVFAKSPPRQEVLTNILGKMDLRIPPGEANHREETSFTFPTAIRVFSLMPHMHLRGKSFEYRVVHPGGREEVLLSVPRYDFAWQSVYRFAEPPLIPRGAKLHLIAHWDNSKNNPANPDPNSEVRFGLQTWEEMMNGWLDYVVDTPG